MGSTPVPPFLAPIEDLRQRLAEAERGGEGRAEVSRLRAQLDDEARKLTANLTPWQRCLLARHFERPHTLDYVRGLFTDWVELHGDRGFADDPAIVAGLARLDGESVAIVGHQKGRDTRERLVSQLRTAAARGLPQGVTGDAYGREVRSRPVISFVDTPGAYPGLDAEERGQAEAIAHNLRDMAALEVPIVVVVTGEGGSGGALAVGIGDRILMMEHAVYSVISPEGCAAILWKDQSEVQRAASALRLTVQRPAPLRHHRRDPARAAGRSTHGPGPGDPHGGRRVAQGAVGAASGQAQRPPKAAVRQVPGDGVLLGTVTPTGRFLRRFSTLLLIAWVAVLVGLFVRGRVQRGMGVAPTGEQAGEEGEDGDKTVRVHKGFVYADTLGVEPNFRVATRETVQFASGWYELRDIEVSMYHRGEVAYGLVAEKARFNQKLREAHATGGAQVSLGSGVVVRADGFVFRGGERVLESTGPVTFAGPGWGGVGGGMRCTLADNNVEIHGGLSLAARDDRGGGPSLVLLAPTAHYSRGESVVTFPAGLTVLREGLRLRGAGAVLAHRRECQRTPARGLDRTGAHGRPSRGRWRGRRRGR